MGIDFRWNAWNLDHAARHGISADEAESVVRDAMPPYPQLIEQRKFRVYGRGTGGRWVHVIYLKDEDGAVFIIHARLVLKGNEKRRIRRRRK